VAHRFAVDLDVERRLEAGELLLLGSRPGADEAVEREVQEVAAAAALVAVGRSGRVPKLGNGVGSEQVRVAVVDRLDLELGLVPSEMEVVLAAQLRAELLRALAIALELDATHPANVFVCPQHTPPLRTRGGAGGPR